MNEYRQAQAHVAAKRRFPDGEHLMREQDRLIFMQGVEWADTNPYFASADLLKAYNSGLRDAINHMADYGAIPSVARDEVDTTASNPGKMCVDRILMEYESGDGNSWLQEFAWMALNSTHKLPGLQLSVSEVGILEPILLGDDGRVWDGHHRILVAVHLGINDVPVVHAKEVRDE